MYVPRVCILQTCFPLLPFVWLLDVQSSLAGILSHRWVYFRSNLKNGDARTSFQADHFLSALDDGMKVLYELEHSQRKPHPTRTRHESPVTLALAPTPIMCPISTTGSMAGWTVVRRVLSLALMINNK
nr:hypothetical protein CFP56_07658 [Quercus suber]